MTAKKERKDLLKLIGANEKEIDALEAREAKIQLKLGGFKKSRADLEAEKESALESLALGNSNAESSLDKIRAKSQALESKIEYNEAAIHKISQQLRGLITKIQSIESVDLPKITREVYLAEAEGLKVEIQKSNLSDLVQNYMTLLGLAGIPSSYTGTLVNLLPDPGTDQRLLIKNRLKSELLN